VKKVLHRARGWSAVWSGRTLRRSLLGDTAVTVEALHALNVAGMLAPNCMAEGWPVGNCPRCGRLTAVMNWGDMPTVCTGCRAARFGERHD
jgi:hypothetical protein